MHIDALSDATCCSLFNSQEKRSVHILDAYVVDGMEELVGHNVGAAVRVANGSIGLKVWYSVLFSVTGRSSHANASAALIALWNLRMETCVSSRSRVNVAMAVKCRIK